MIDQNLVSKKTVLQTKKLLRHIVLGQRAHNRVPNAIMLLSNVKLGTKMIQLPKTTFVDAARIAYPDLTPEECLALLGIVRVSSSYVPTRSTMAYRLTDKFYDYCDELLGTGPDRDTELCLEAQRVTKQATKHALADEFYNGKISDIVMTVAERDAFALKIKTTHPQIFNWFNYFGLVDKVNNTTVGSPDLTPDMTVTYREVYKFSHLSHMFNSRSSASYGPSTWPTKIRHLFTEEMCAAELDLSSAHISLANENHPQQFNSEALAAAESLKQTLADKLTSAAAVNAEIDADLKKRAKSAAKQIVLSIFSGGRLDVSCMDIAEDAELGDVFSKLYVSDDDLRAQCNTFKSICGNYRRFRISMFNASGQKRPKQDNSDKDITDTQLFAFLNQQDERQKMTEVVNFLTANKCKLLWQQHDGCTVQPPRNICIEELVDAFNKVSKTKLSMKFCSSKIDKFEDVSNIVYTDELVRKTLDVKLTQQTSGMHDKTIGRGRRIRRPVDVSKLFKNDTENTLNDKTLYC